MAKYTVRLANGSTCGHTHRSSAAAGKCLLKHLPTIASVVLVGASPPANATSTTEFGGGFRLNPPGVLAAHEVPQKKGRKK